ncbi:TetR/AcrR family transcriptional regulator [Aliiglaciecola sp. LCG003]|uniref:acrylate utilization transcriptional regulator AcuR n=1 Tax=Aliiglaciecola sp. LCG003 TaxID=3053655 RepID=UPI002572CA83|nr:TetR/AcrR family transcriptional regulator [Aliiglaciecola sp. LCG003]WJG07905.1 TetR/AcrR family transcriptional regulator [Aliiglaciecola sp. LCG003]
MNTSASKPRRGRPPKISRVNCDTRAELIRSGLEQLTEHGFTSSGIEPILKKIGVPKGSFYHYFSSKEAFGQELIENYANYFSSKLDVHLLDHSAAPLARIASFVEDAKAGMQRHQFKRGCLIGNLGQEVDSLPAGYRQLLMTTFASWQQRIQRCLEQAKVQKQISATADCEQLAEYFWLGWEGAVSRAKLVQESTPLDNFLSCFIAGLPR